MDSGTEMILAIIYAVAQDKPKEVQQRYAQIMHEVLEIGGKESEC